MQTRGRALRLTAVVAMMGLALTGFSTGRGHGHKSGSDGDGGGGGCSSSSQNHGGSSSYNNSTSGSTSGGTGGSRALSDGTARLVSCATETRPYATVEITNPNNRAAEFQAAVTFYDDEGSMLFYGSSVTVRVPADGTAKTRVELGKHLLTSVARCEADPEAEVSP
ncbi:hypothetical protein [Streptomyces sp. YU58]|uniref:hypothetical protein n=1 Tax=Streptomyces sp. SX92 TaxID=3158972 RepID=UPI0027B8AAF0|nr:hypothetical protein [Streptomyces coralus]WLW54241.1 hypothetical protein QU709_24070 [Streptomyces coralus]